MIRFCRFFFGLILLLGISGRAFSQQNVQRDSDGKLLPHLSYHEVVMRGMNFILNEHDEWFKGDRSVLKDEAGTELPAYVLYANLQKNGELFPDAIDRFVSYPAFHHAAYIATFLRYYEYSGDRDALSKAKVLADWNIAHSTPADWPYGSLPYSTYYQGQPGGFRDGNTIMTDKPAMMGLAYLGLYKATGEEKYLNASFAISRTLAQTQSEEGNWPFRVNPQTKEVKEQYTSSAVYALQLFEGVDKFRGTDFFKKNADRTFQWIMKNPVRTNRWLGFYEDIANDSTNRTNYDCMDFIRYLLSGTRTIKNNQSIALQLNSFIECKFLDRPKDYEPAEAIREQLACFETMGDHSAHWAAMLADLYHSTGDKHFRDRAIQTMNFVSYQLEPNNIILTGPTYPQWWYSGHFITIFYLLDFMNSFPEFVPEDESHILYSSGGIAGLTYSSKSIVYRTLSGSEERMKLAFIPRQIMVDGKILPALQGNKVQWKYDWTTRLLILNHAAGTVQITGN